MEFGQFDAGADRFLRQLGPSVGIRICLNIRSSSRAMRLSKHISKQRQSKYAAASAQALFRRDAGLRHADPLGDFGAVELVVFVGRAGSDLSACLADFPSQSRRSSAFTSAPCNARRRRVACPLAQHPEAARHYEAWDPRLLHSQRVRRRQNGCPSARSCAAVPRAHVRIAAGMLDNCICTWPATRSTIDGPLPLCGTCTSLILVIELKSSAARWPTVPLPAVE